MRKAFDAVSNSHKIWKVSQYKKGKDSLSALGKRRYDMKQKGFGGQTKPIFRKKAKQTKKVVLKLECASSKKKRLLVLRRSKTVIIGQTKEVNPYY